MSGHTGPEAWPVPGLLEKQRLGPYIPTKTRESFKGQKLMGNLSLQYC